ncbi:hypothetical protein [Alkalihalobacillus sp. BA299]|uniref:hypothetical protein n=1 Tax=Alkalihalobacillus sp. BA299 TaxID=2815938 RepID=UPI001ADC6094|nr:hypothetical protein [Alkalihalobacillus sp. BA299]
MEAAFFLGTVFDIELKRKELEAQNLSRDEIRATFEKDYRTFSRKSAFTCLCCNKPVNMNLTKDEGRPFFFKHIDGEECTYSENNKTYDSHIVKHEDKRRKDIGLTVFKEIAEGQMKPFGIEIERGYFYKKKLSFIPDFILKFPYSDQAWAIDYFTSIGQGLTNGSYARHLRQRMETYKSEGFKVFSFIDNTWLAIDRGTAKGTLLSAEKNVTMKENEDYRWDAFLNNELTNETLSFLKEEIGIYDLNIDTKSISYVDIDNRICKIIRFLEAGQSERNLTFYKLAEIDVPLDRALSLNPNHDNLLLHGLNEDDVRQEFKVSLLRRLEIAEAEKKAREEKLKIEEELKKSREKKEFERKVIGEKYYNDKEINEEELTTEMEKLAREASDRPVDMSPEEWEWYKKTGRRFTRRNNMIQTKQPSVTYESVEQKIKREKREKLKDKLLTFPITGESYLNGEREHWRRCVLKWIKVHTQEDELTISISKLLNNLKAEGITFNQNEKIVQYPIKNFINFYQQEVKKDLKMKLNLTYID